MLKLPALMAPCLLGKKVNSETFKKTIMEKQFTYKDETIQSFQELVENKELKINGIKDLSGKEIEDFGAKLGLSHDKKSAEVVKIDLINLCNIFLGGQVIALEKIFEDVCFCC